MADFLESVILDNQACQVLAVSSYSYRHVVRIDVTDKKSQVIVDRMKYGQITVLGDAFACRFTLDHFPNMETESYPDQADAICDWIDSMIRMESEFPNLFKIPSSIGGKADVYVVGDGRITPYT